MRIHRTTLVLAVALGISSGCRSASMAHRSSKQADRAIARVAKSAADCDTAQNHPTPAISADDDTDPIRPVSADQNDAQVTLAKSVAATNSTGRQDHDTESMELRLSDMTATRRFSIREAIETGLAQNPDLVTLRQNEGVGNAAVGVAQTYPFNPFIQVQTTPYQRNPLGGSGSTYHYVLLMQQIQLGHQQQYREAAACAALNGIRWNVLQAELLNVAMTERLYFAAVYQQGLRDLANLYAENNRQLLDILQRQQEAGQATGADVAIVRLDARSTRQQQRIAEANLQTALLDLKRHLRLPPECEMILDKDVVHWVWQSANPAQLASLAACRPDVMAARADTDTARANSNLADASRTPDLQIGPYYQRDDFGTCYLGFRAQADIPVINNGMPLLRQRNAELFQRATAAQQLGIRANLEAMAAADRYERARLLREDSSDSPHASVPVELQRLEEQFKANEVDILRVMQARTSLLQSQRADLDALNELMQAAVAVTAASGAPLEFLAVEQESQSGLPNPE